jgi:WD40 repeat protein
MTEGKMSGPGALLSGCCMRVRIRVMAYRALRGDKKALRGLADNICNGDPEAAEPAKAALRTPVSPAIREAFCTEVMARDSPALFRFALLSGYLPLDLPAQALFLFLAGEQDRFLLLDPEPYPLLAEAYRGAPAGTRARVRGAARRTGRSPVFARMFMGEDGMPGTAAWSPDEWELVLAGLAEAKAWEDLWQFLFSAPVGSALAALHALRCSGWTPAGDDRSVWDGIMGVLPDAWHYPVFPAGAELVFDTPDHQVVRFAFSSDSSLLATGDSSGRARIWHAGHGTQICSLPPAGDGPLVSLHFSPDGNRLLLCGSGGVLRCHNARDGALLWSFPDGRCAITCCCPAGEGQSWLAGNGNGEVCCIDTATGRQETLAGGRGVPVTALVTLPGSEAAAGYADGSVIITVSGGESLRRLSAPSGDPVKLLVPCPDGAGLLVLSESTHPVLRDIRTGELLQTFSGTSGRAACTAAAPDASWFAVAANDHTLRIWVQGRKEPAATVPFYKHGITTCMAIAGGALLTCGYSDGYVRIVRVPEGIPAGSRKAHTKGIAAISFSPDGHLLAVSGWDGAVTLSDPLTLQPLRTLSRQAGGAAGLSLSSCGTYAVAGHENGIAVIYDCRNGGVVRSFPLYCARIKATALSPDGALLASSGDDSSLRLWDVRDGSLVATPEGLTTSATALAFSSDGKVFFAAGWDGKLRSWSVPDGRPLDTVPCHASTITCCTISGDGKFIVTGSNDTTVSIRRLPGTEPVAVLAGFESEVGAVALSPRGDLLAAGGADGKVRLFHFPGGEDAGTIPLPPGTVTALAFTRDGTVLAAGYRAGTIVHLSVPERRLIRVQGTHAAAVTGLAVTPCGTMLVSSGADGKVRRFPLPWSRPLSATTPEDVPAVAEGAAAAAFRANRRAGDGAGNIAGDGEGIQYAFLRRLLAARFRSEVGLFMPEDDLGAFDIRIVG